MADIVHHYPYGSPEFGSCGWLVGLIGVVSWCGWLVWLMWLLGVVGWLVLLVWLVGWCGWLVLLVWLAGVANDRGLLGLSNICPQFRWRLIGEGWKSKLLRLLSSCDGRVYSTKVKVQKARVHKFVGQIQTGLLKSS